jgi:hypothetical protein
MIWFYVGKLISSLIWDWARKLRLGKWSTISWERWEWIKRYLGLLGGSPCPGRLRTVSCWALWNMHWMYWRMRDSWGSINIVASVTAWSNYNCYSMVDVGGEWGRPGWRQGQVHTVEPRFHLECEGAISTSEGLSERWPYVRYWRQCVCCVVRFSLARLYTIWISATLSIMSDGLIRVSERSNWTSFMIHMYYEMDVDDNYLYQMLIDYNCMLSISANIWFQSLLTWIKLDSKRLNLVVVGLRVSITWSLACLEVDCSVMLGQSCWA